MRNLAMSAPRLIGRRVRQLGRSPRDYNGTDNNSDQTKILDGKRKLTIVDRMHGANAHIPFTFLWRTSVSSACTRARSTKSRCIDPYSTRIAESPA